MNVFAASLVAVVFLGAMDVEGQSFVNLDFEAAQIVPNPDAPGFVSASLALPGWEFAPNPGVGVAYNNFSLGGAMVVLYGPGYSPATEILQGNYSLQLNTQMDNAQTGASISQSGTVPLDALSIRFRTAPDPSIQVSLNGQPLPLFQILAESNREVYGADISGFAGEFGSLQFSTGDRVGRAVIDGINFSPVAVPEPGIAKILGFAMLLWFGRRLGRGCG